MGAVEKREDIYIEDNAAASHNQSTEQKDFNSSLLNELLSSVHSLNHNIHYGVPRVL